MGVLPNPFQQKFEVAVGAQTVSVDFQGASRELNWLEISLEYDKSYAHETVYDSYGLELAAKLIESIKFVNASKAYSLTGKLSYDINNKDEKYQMYKMFVAYVCNGATFAPLSEYKNNPVYQDMTDEFEYRENTKDDRIYIDMRRSKGNYDELEKITRDDSGLVIYIKLKAAATAKMRLRVVGYSQGEYWYAYTNKGYIMTYQNYKFQKLTNSKMETLEVMKYWVLLFLIWFFALIVVGWIKGIQGIINNGNILTDGRCFKNCR